MAFILVISFSLISQLAAAIITLSIIFISKKKFALILISVAMFFMAIRRFIPLYYAVFDNTAITSNMANEIIGLLLSVLMVAGALLLRPVFTEQKKAEENIRLANQKLNDIIEFLPDATFVIDKDKKVIAWNRAVETMTGVKKEHMIGRSDYSTTLYYESRPILIDIALEPREAVKVKYPTLVMNQNQVQAEAFVPKAWGAKGAYCWAYASRLLDSDGNVIGAIESVRDVTEKHLALQRLNDIIEFLPDATFVIDKDKKVIAWNRAVETMTGVKKEQMIGRSDYSTCFYHNVQPILIDIALNPTEAAKISYPSLVIGDNKVQAEAFVPKVWNNKGAYCWFVASKLLDSDGNVIGAIESIRDITERKAVEENLRQSESRIRGIIETALDGFWVLDSEGIIREVNDAYCRMSGFTKEEIVGHPVNDFETAEKPEDTQKRIRKIFTLGSDRFETVHKRKDGALLNVEISALKSFREADELFVFLHNISENKRTHEALMESEARVRAKLNAILTPEGDIGELELEDIIDVPAIQSMMDYFYSITHVGIGIVDNRGKVLVGTGWQDICTNFFRANPETRKNCVESDLQLSSGVESGRFKIYKCLNNMWDIATPIIVGGKKMGNLFLGQFFFQDESPDMDYFRNMARKYGFSEENFIAAVGRVPVWSHELVDAAMGFYIRFALLVSSLGYNNIRLAQTLTRQKAIEDELRDMNLNLENRITKAVAELRAKDQMMILQSRQAAMGEMLGNIAHQWRQPLNIIGISVQNIQESEKAGQLNRAYLEENVPRIMSQILQMSRTIDDFRNFFKPDKAKTDFDLSESARDALNFLDMSFKDHGVEVITDLPENIMASGYPNEFSQVLLNILNNALDAINERKQESPRLTIKAFRQSDRSVITVTDNAGGIDPKILHKIFDPYFTTKEMGTGIGLYMAKTIIEKNMGGRLIARNAENGAEFRIEMQ